MEKRFKARFSSLIHPGSPRFQNITVIHSCLSLHHVRLHYDETGTPGVKSYGGPVGLHLQTLKEKWIWKDSLLIWIHQCVGFGRMEEWMQEAVSPHLLSSSPLPAGLWQLTEFTTRGFLSKFSGADATDFSVRGRAVLVLSHWWVRQE